jgi:hypothetical protein
MVVVNQRSSLAHTAPLRSYRKLPHGCCQRATEPAAGGHDQLAGVGGRNRKRKFAVRAAWCKLPRSLANN